MNRVDSSFFLTSTLVGTDRVVVVVVGEMGEVRRTGKDRGGSHLC